jgi:hypothetical protein
MLKRLRQKSARAAAGVVNRLADARVNDLDHDADDFAGREELPAVVALLAHFQQQPFVDLREGKNVGRVHRLRADVVNFVENV